VWEKALLRFPLARAFQIFLGGLAEVEIDYGRRTEEPTLPKNLRTSHVGRGHREEEKVK